MSIIARLGYVKEGIKSELPDGIQVVLYSRPDMVDVSVTKQFPRMDNTTPRERLLSGFSERSHGDPRARDVAKPAWRAWLDCTLSFRGS